MFYFLIVETVDKPMCNPATSVPSADGTTCIEIDTTPVPYLSAEMACAKIGAQLVSLENKEKAEAVSMFLQQFYKFIPVNYFFIGKHASHIQIIVLERIA